MLDPQVTRQACDNGINHDILINFLTKPGLKDRDHTSVELLLLFYIMYIQFPRYFLCSEGDLDSHPWGATD
jgi:hypothetical protein